MQSALAVFAVQCQHAQNLLDQLRKQARDLKNELAFSDCESFLTSAHTLAHHAAESARLRVEKRVALEQHAAANGVAGGVYAQFIKAGDKSQ